MTRAVASPQRGGYGAAVDTLPALTHVIQYICEAFGHATINLIWCTEKRPYQTRQNALHILTSSISKCLWAVVIHNAVMFGPLMNRSVWLESCVKLHLQTTLLNIYFECVKKHQLQNECTHIVVHWDLFPNNYKVGIIATDKLLYN